MEKFRDLKFWGNVFLMVSAIVAGMLTGGVIMAAAPALPDAGNVNDDLSSISNNEDLADEDYYTKEIDERITKIRPMATPLDNISRNATAKRTRSMEVKYYSVGTRPIKTTLKAAVTEQTSGTTISLIPSDAKMFTEADTIRVVGVKGYKSDGATVDTKDLVLSVCGKDNSGNPTVCAVNGKSDGNGANSYLPDIAAGTTLIRMGKACAELDAQAPKFTTLPTAEVQYCQNFMTQVEQSKIEEIQSKEVNWKFSDLEEDSIFDMKMGMENSYMFGVKGSINHPVKEQKVWATGGIWWMAGKDLVVGEYDEAKGEAVITDDELVDITKDLFTGVGVGNKRKILFAGSKMLAAFSKIKSEKFRLKEPVEKWNLKFKSFDTDFGEILVIHHELFDQNAMSDCGLVIDPDFLTKVTYLPWGRNVLDLKKAGIRNSNAVVLQEISALYLRYAKAHARLRLATA